MTLGNELRLCPRRRPNLVWGIAPLVLGVGFLALTIAILSSDGMKASDRNFMLVLSGIFVGTGGLLLWLRSRTLAKQLVFRVYERGIVRETRDGRHELPFDQLARLRVRTTVVQFWGTQHAILLVPREGKKLRILSQFVDNVDPSLVSLLEQRSGLRAEAL